MHIATLTLNPALDVTTATERVRPTHKLRCGPPSFEPGGGGINVARVIHALDGQVTAVFPRGGPPGAMVEALLRKAGVPVSPFEIDGQMRESFTVDERATGQQYRFVVPGPDLSREEREALIDQLTALQPAPSHLIVSGSLPTRCDPAIFWQLADRCRKMAAKLVIDTSGPALAACEGLGAFLIKPSLREVEELVGRGLVDEQAQAIAGRELHDRGFAEVLVISLGDQGAIMVTPEETLRMRAIPVAPGGGAVGAGDAMVAALTLAFARGKPPAEALRLGVSAGAAALMTPAAELARRSDVERLYAGTAASDVSAQKRA